MKKNLHIILTILAVIVIGIFFFTYRAPFEWTPTMDTADDNPFGCQLFDKLASHTLDGDYKVADNIPEGLNPQSDAILYVKRHIFSDWTEYDSIEADRAKALYEFAEKGGVVIVATSDFYSNWESDNDDIIIKAYGLRFVDEKRKAGNGYDDLSSTISQMKNDPVERENVTLVSSGEKYALYPFMIDYCFDACFDKRIHTPLITTRHQYGKWDSDINDYATTPMLTARLAYYRTFPSGGKIVYSSMPMLFTNYAVMDGKTVELTLSLLSQANHRNITRIMGKNPRYIPSSIKKEKNNSAFSYLLSQPPLRWALYLTMAVLVLYCIFNAKRKMRPIPLIPETKNATLEFSKFMGTFYYRRNKHGAIVLAKYDDMLFTFSKIIDADTDKMTNQQLSEALSLHTGISQERLITLIRTANRIRNNTIEISSQTMKSMLELIQEINDNS